MLKNRAFVICINQDIFILIVLESLQYEPMHDKTNKMICAPSKDSVQTGYPPSLISLRCVLSG